MTTLLLTDPAFLAHETIEGHPERPDRLRAIDAALAAPQFLRLARGPAPLAREADILRAHPKAYLDRLEAAAPQVGLAHLDADTMLSPGTLEACYRASGGVVRGVDAVFGGTARNAFIAARPPGHHAETATAMGFCFFNHIAIAARYAQAMHGVSRVAILDWDVHHGNGTEEIFWADASVLYASTHQSPLFPGTGALTDRGEHDTIVNVPLREGTSSAGFRQAMQGIVLPRLEAFRPELILISAGFDAHRLDPLGGLLLDEADFAWVTREVMGIADRCCAGRIVSLLEGGYDLKGLALSVAAHVGALMQA